jgi:hypothetical protein
MAFRGSKNCGPRKLNPGRRLSDCVVARGYASIVVAQMIDRVHSCQSVGQDEEESMAGARSNCVPNFFRVTYSAFDFSVSDSSTGERLFRNRGFSGIPKYG